MKSEDNIQEHTVDFYEELMNKYKILDKRCEEILIKIKKRKNARK